MVSRNCDDSGMARYLLILVVPLLQGCQSIMEGMFLPTDGVRPAELSTREAQGVPVMMRDGVTLVADIYHPKTDHASPTILVRIPFANTFKNRFKSRLIARYWASSRHSESDLRLVSNTIGSLRIPC